MAAENEPGEEWSPAHNPYSIATSESTWILWTLDLCAHRVRTGRDPARQIDGRLFVVTLRQLLYAAEMQRKAIANEVSSQVVESFNAALARFHHEIPDLAAIRNVLTHFDAYAVGEGDLQKKEIRKGMSSAAAARKYWGGGYDPSTGEFTSGPYAVHIERALIAADELASSIYAAAKAVDFARIRRVELQASLPANEALYRSVTGVEVDTSPMAVTMLTPIALE